VIQLVKEQSHIVESKDSFPFSQVTAAYLYIKQDK